MKRHRLDFFSLLSGLVFFVTGAAFLFTDVDIAETDPALFLFAGFMIFGLLAAAVGLRRGSVPPQD